MSHLKNLFLLNIDFCSNRFLQRGLSEAQNGYGFGMLPGHGRPDVQFSSLGPLWKEALKISKLAGRALRPLRMVCIIGICPGIFSVGPGIPLRSAIR